jgi:hypothetical protein
VRASPGRVRSAPSGCPQRQRVAVASAQRPILGTAADCTGDAETVRSGLARTWRTALDLACSLAALNASTSLRT